MELVQVQLFREHLRVIERIVDNQLKEQKLCCDISLAQCHALLALGKFGECSIRDLAANLNLDKSTLSRTIDNLVKRGLVHRVIHEQDRRFMQVSLTKDGSAMVSGINHSCNDLYLNILNQIPAEKQNIVLEGIALLADAINRVEGDKSND